MKTNKSKISPRLGRQTAPRGVNISSSTAPNRRVPSSSYSLKKRFLCRSDHGNGSFIRGNSAVASDAAAGFVVIRRAAKNATNRLNEDDVRDRSTREQADSIHRPRSGGRSRGRRSVQDAYRQVPFDRDLTRQPDRGSEPRFTLQSSFLGVVHGAGIAVKDFDATRRAPRVTPAPMQQVDSGVFNRQHELLSRVDHNRLLTINR